MTVRRGGYYYGIYFLADWNKIRKCIIYVKIVPAILIIEVNFDTPQAVFEDEVELHC